MAWFFGANNSGVARFNDGRPVRFGLCNESAETNRNFKSSDLIGIGNDGRFIAVEVKRPQGRRPAAQKRYIDLVRKYGGVGFFVETLLKNFTRK